MLPNSLLFNYGAEHGLDRGQVMWEIQQVGLGEPGRTLMVTNSFPLAGHLVATSLPMKSWVCGCSLDSSPILLEDQLGESVFLKNR